MEFSGNNGEILNQIRLLIKQLIDAGITVDTNINIDKYGGSVTTLGQKTMANSIPVVIASDQAISVDSNVNIDEIHGTATDVNNGIVSPGTIRVTIASDSTGQVKLATGSAEIGNVKNSGTFATQATLQAGTAIVGKVGIDQTTPGTTNATSLAQLGSTTISTGNGISGAGVLRVAQVSDGTGLISAKLQDGSGNAITSTSSALDVNIKSGAVPAGENHIGAIGGNTFEQITTQTTQNAAYSAGNCVGGLITLTNAMRTSGGTGIIQSIHLIDKDNQKAAMDLLVFNANPTAATITDKTAFVYSTDITKQIARIPIAASDYVTYNSIATVSLGGLSKIVKANGSQTLYGALVTSGTPSYTGTSQVIIQVDILQD